MAAAPRPEAPQIEATSPSECWIALRGTDVGRICFVVDGSPEVFPINYVVDGGTVVFRTGAHSTITSALDGRPVAFEADGHTDGQAWSVIVKGEAREVVGLYDSLAATELPLHPQQAGPKDRLARVTPSGITGRRFAVADPHTWDTAVTAAPHSAPE